MATADEVVTILRADTAQHDARIANSAAQFEKQMARMAAAAERAGKATSLLGTNPAFDRFIQNADKVPPAIDRVTKSTKQFNMELRYLPAQLNDIAVQLAGGQSPFLIMLQQGSQINQALGGMGLRGTLTALGGAFGSLLNPISLATFALIGVGGIAVQYFADIITGGEDSEQVLQKQAQLIQQVADKWGDALPALREYANEQKKLADAAERTNAVQDATNKILEGTRDNWAAISDAAGPSMQALAGAFIETEREMDSLDKKIKDGTASTEDFSRVSDILTQILGSDAVRGNDKLRESIEALRAAYLKAAEAASSLVAQQAALTGLPGREGRLGQPSLEEFQQNYDADLAMRRRMYPEDFPQQPAPSKRKKARAPRSQLDTEDRIDNDIEAIRRRTEALKLEQDTLRLTYKEQVERKTQFDLEEKALKRLREEAQKKGQTDLENIHLSEAQKQSIAAVSQAYAEQADQLRKAQQVMQFQRDMLKGLFDDVRHALDDGKITAEEFGDIFINVLDKIIDKIENNLIDAILNANGALSGGGSGGGLLGGILSLFGGQMFPGGMGFVNSTVGLWAGGGYTGDGGKFQKAGDVHKGEYVFDQDSVRAAGGPGVLDAMRARLLSSTGYANGGLGGMPSRLPSFVPGSGRSGSNVYSPNYSIDARGAQAGVGAEIRKALKEYDKNQAPLTWHRISQDQRKS